MTADLSRWTSAHFPDGRTLEGTHARLERLDPARHGDDLWGAVENHDSIWEYLGYGPFTDKAAFLDWLASRAPLSDPLSYAVIDRHSDTALGVATLMETRPAMGVIEVGHIFFAPALQRTPAATEAIFTTPQHPYTRALLAAAPQPDPALRRSIPLLQGDLPSPANPPSGCVFRTRCPHANAACADHATPLREIQPGHWTACWRTDIH